MASADPGATAAPPPARTERREFDPKTGQWVRVAAPIAGTEEGDIELARANLARGEFSAARKLLKAWRKTHQNSAKWPAGLFYSADVEVSAVEAGKSGDLWQAYKWYEEILNGWAGSEWSDRALRREMLIAEFFLFKGKKRWVWKGMLRLPATDEGVEILNRIMDDRAPGTRIAEQALRLKADYLYQAGEFEDAEEAYARLARDFPRGPNERLALLRSADSAFASFPGIPYDDTPLLAADERYRKYADRFPDAAAAEGVDQRLGRIAESRAEKEYQTGRFYERTHFPHAARYYDDFVVRTWPNTTAAAQAQVRLSTLPPGGPISFPPPATASAPARP